MHKFSPHNAAKLENPERYELLQPQKSLEKLGLRKGMCFVDIGAGTGFFSRAASEIVSTKGIVYALDMSEEMVEIVKKNGVPDNMRVMLSAEYRLPLPDALADVSLLSTVLHENTDVKKLLAEAARVTKSSGKIVIIEWKKQEEEMGPPKDERLGQDELVPQLSSFDILDQGDLTGSHYYIVLGKSHS